MTNNAFERAQESKAGFDRIWQGNPLSYQKDGLTLVIDRRPELLLNRSREIVGIDSTIKAFDTQGREIEVDPHRLIVNPPLYGTSGISIVNNQRILGTPDPVEALVESILDSIRIAPNPQNFRTRGTVTTIFGETSDGQIESNDASYATARLGSNLVAESAGDHITVGQLTSANFFVYEGFLAFNTSSIIDTDIVSAIVLSLFLAINESDQDFTFRVREFDWSGGGLLQDDWLGPSGMPSKPLLATLSTSGLGTSAYSDFISEVAFLSINNLKVGTSYFLIHSSRHQDNNTPVGDEYVLIFSANTVGTSGDPKLTITHEAEAPPNPLYMAARMG